MLELCSRRTRTQVERRSSLLILIYTCLTPRVQPKLLFLFILKQIWRLLAPGDGGGMWYPWLAGGQARRRWEAGDLLDPRAPTPPGTMHMVASGFQDLELRSHLPLL